MKQISANSRFDLSSKRVFEDTEKKIQILFDQLNNNEIPKEICEKLSEMINSNIYFLF